MKLPSLSPPAFWTRLPRRKKLVLGLVAPFVLMGLCFVGSKLWWLQHAKRFQAVRPGMLYRTGQPTEAGFRHLVRSLDIRTVLCLQSFHPQLKKRFDTGRPDGAPEAQFVRDLQVNFMQWPLGEEACWPWPTPWMFEEFFALMDDPANWPVLLHCQGGRHRTGTLSALFRLEYDRWPVDRALAEMYSFQFGPPVPVQEHNLRTYYPRPRPNDAEWQALRQAFAEFVDPAARDDYQTFVWQLRTAGPHQAGPSQAVCQRAEAYLRSHEPFALELAQRLVDSPAHPLAPMAAELAQHTLSTATASDQQLSIAAALVADFGTEAQQAELLQMLGVESPAGPVSQRYRALVRGVTNRYTPNRLAYLRPLLRDERPRPEPECPGIRYCDTAVARLTTIIDHSFLSLRDTPTSFWDNARQRAETWFAEHPEQARLSQYLPPAGQDKVQALERTRVPARR